MEKVVKMASNVNDFVVLPEYVNSEDKDRAYYFINMLLETLPLKSDIKDGEIDGVNVKLSYHKTVLKREADFKVCYEKKYYSCKFLHSKIHRYGDLETNWLVAFILNHKKEIEEFIK